MRNDRREIDPSLMEMDVETKYISRTSTNVRRVKMNRGDSWLCRFLPASLGPKGLWFARIGKHWVNHKGIICPRHTSPDFGGDPDAYCPSCETSDELQDNASEAVSKFAWQARGNAQWLTYCLVFEKSSGAGMIAVADEESVLPYEFQHYRNSFEELMAFYRNSLRKDNARGILDWVRGCDFYASKTAKGIRLDKQESQPIFPDIQDPATDPRIKKIIDQMKTPRVVIPSEKEMKDFADKLYEAAMLAGHAGGGRGGRRSGGYDEVEDAEDTAPRRSARRTASRAPSLAEDEDQISGAEAPADEIIEDDNSAEEPVQEDEQAGNAAEPEPEPEPVSAPVPTRKVVPGAAPAPRTASAAPAPRTAPAVTRPAPTSQPVARTAPAASARPVPAARPLARPAPVPLQRTSAAKIDEEEELPEEANDPAPPVEKPLATAMEEPAEPPPTVRRAGGTSTTLATSLLNRIADVTRKGSPAAPAK